MPVPFSALEKLMGVSECPVLGSTWDEIEILATGDAKLRRPRSSHLQEPLALVLLLVLDLVCKKLHPGWIGPRSFPDHVSLSVERRNAVLLRLKRKYGLVLGCIVYKYLQDHIVEAVERMSSDFIRYDTWAENRKQHTQLVNRRARIVDDFRDSCEHVLGAELTDLFRRSIEILRHSRLILKRRDANDVLLTMAVMGVWQLAGVEYCNRILPEGKREDYL